MMGQAGNKSLNYIKNLDQVQENDIFSGGTDLHQQKKDSAKKCY